MKRKILLSQLSNQGLWIVSNAMPGQVDRPGWAMWCSRCQHASMLGHAQKFRALMLFCNPNRLQFMFCSLLGRFFVANYEMFVAHYQLYVARHGLFRETGALTQCRAQYRNKHVGTDDEYLPAGQTTAPSLGQKFLPDTRAPVGAMKGKQKECAATTKPVRI